MKKKSHLSKVESEIVSRIAAGEITPVHVPRRISAVDILKFELCSEIIRLKKRTECTQATIAAELEVHKSEISKLFSYQLDAFSVDRLLGMVEALLKSGADVSLAAALREASRKVEAKTKRQAKSKGVVRA